MSDKFLPTSKKEACTSYHACETTKTRGNCLDRSFQGQSDLQLNKGIDET